MLWSYFNPLSDFYQAPSLLQRQKLLHTGMDVETLEMLLFSSFSCFATSTGWIYTMEFFLH